MGKGRKEGGKEGRKKAKMFKYHILKYKVERAHVHSREDTALSDSLPRWPQPLLSASYTVLTSMRLAIQCLKGPPREVGAAPFVGHRVQGKEHAYWPRQHMNLRKSLHLIESPTAHSFDGDTNTYVTVSNDSVCVEWPYGILKLNQTE